MPPFDEYRHNQEQARRYINEFLEIYLGFPEDVAPRLDDLHYSQAHAEEIKEEFGRYFIRWIKRRMTRYVYNTQTWHWTTQSMKVVITFVIFLDNCRINNDPHKDMIYPTISRLNHSCQPNAEYSSYNAPIRDVLQVVATSDIKAGERITISYDPRVSDPTNPMDRAQRQYMLRALRFTCICQRCEAES